ncbi:MAG: hypothetical protein J2P55_06185 [Rhizobiales bacterium]|nr:hypothetical protein [Hyphomicrobiales bacterium]
MTNIDDADRIVAEFSNEQTSPIDIGCHMVNAAANLAERNFGFYAKSRLARLRKGASCRSNKYADGRKRDK